MSDFLHIRLDKATALRIQAAHVESYAAVYGSYVRELVAAATTADALQDGVLYDIVTINRHIPRGGKIEFLIDRKRAIEAKFTEQLNPTKDCTNV